MPAATRYVNLAIFMSVLLLASAFRVTPVLAVDCSDAPVVAPVVVACSCGDRVVGTKHLTGADPVTLSPSCPGDGLIIGASNLVLDMNGQTITGQGAGVGVKFEPGLSNVKVRDGVVTGFGAGIKTQASIGGTFSNIRILRSTGAGLHLDGSGAQIGYPGALSPLLLQYNGGTAVEIVGSGNTLGEAIIRDSDGGGISVLGDNNILTTNRLERTGGVGIIANGAGNTVTRSVILQGDGDGIQILGTHAEVSLNQVKQNDGVGIDLAGSDHKVVRNLVQTNGGDGLLVTATGSRFDRNQMKANGGYGIEDETSGGGTSGTANTYTLNTCSSDAKGKSTPTGLCR